MLVEVLGPDPYDHTNPNTAEYGRSVTTVLETARRVTGRSGLVVATWGNGGDHRRRDAGRETCYLA